MIVEDVLKYEEYIFKIDRFNLLQDKTSICM
jgi:hypothetical protein